MSALLLAPLLWAAQLQAVSVYDDTVNSRPPQPAEQTQATELISDTPTVFQPFDNTTDYHSSFNDSAMLDAFNERYVQRMLARTAAITLSAELSECLDQEEECQAWTAAGYCFTNAGFMSIACSRSCDVCSLAECEDNHATCSQWAGDGECSANPAYMTVACRKSCGQCGDPPSAPLACQEEGTNYQGRLAARVEAGVLSWPACSAVCSAREGCTAWSWVREGTGPYALNCATMEGFSNKAPDPNTVAGGKGCMAPGSTEVFTTSPSVTTTGATSTTTTTTTTTTITTTTTTSPTSECQEEGVNYQGRKSATVVIGVVSWPACSDLCTKREGCTAWTWVKDKTGPYALNCALMESFSNKAMDPNTVAGDRGCKKSKPSTTTTSTTPSWSVYESLDCYLGQGGLPIQPDPLDTLLGLEECRAACRETPGCVAVVRRTGDGGQQGVCYLRREVQVEQCVKDNVWSLHQLLDTVNTTTITTTTTTSSPAKEWSRHPGKDCYSGAGGQPLEGVADPLEATLTEAGCREECLARNGCVGIVRKTREEEGLCYLRGGLQLGRCEEGTPWTVQTNTRLEEGEGEEGGESDGACSDSNQYCSAWARNGECSKSSYYMKVYCSKACGLCEGGGGGELPTDSGSCRDKDSSCLALAKEGHCYAKPGQEDKVTYMETKCRRSCGFCGALPNHMLDQQSCAAVTSIPRHVVQKYSIDTRWYGKFTQAYGLPITASSSVDDRALMRMCYIVRWLYASHRSVRRAAHANFGRFIIIGKSQRTTEMPEYRGMDAYYDERARGFGGHVTSTSEENLLYLQKNKWRGMDMAAHEVAHNLHLTGLERGLPAVFRVVSGAYSSAMAAGKYYLGSYSMYARTDYREYWAEALDSYIGDTWASVPPHNAAELSRYDPTVYRALQQALPCNKIGSWIYVHNDIDQVLSRTQRLNINYPSCRPEPATNIPDEKVVSLQSAKQGKSYTSTREQCRFPFTFNGRTYTSCTTAAHSGNWYRSSWCATTTYSNSAWYDSATPSHQNSWGYCGADPAQKAQSCRGTFSGAACVFPFTYLGITHSSCQGHGWCATKLGPGGQMEEWSRCLESCYSREEGEGQTRGYSALSG